MAANSRSAPLLEMKQSVTDAGSIVSFGARRARTATHRSFGESCSKARGGISMATEDTRREDGIECFCLGPRFGSFCCCRRLVHPCGLELGLGLQAG